MLGRKNNLPKGEVMYLRIRSKDENDQDVVPANFVISKKGEDGKWAPIAKTEQTVTGDLFRIDFGKGEYENREYKTAKIYLNDSSANEIYILDLRYNLLTRNLFNSILALKELDNISISLYKVKGKKETNKDKEYSAIALWQKDTLIKGKFKSEELPKPEEVKNNKGVVLQRDYSDLDTFLEKELKEFVQNSLKKKEENQADQDPEDINPEDKQKNGINEDTLF